MEGLETIIIVLIWLFSVYLGYIRKPLTSIMIPFIAYLLIVPNYFSQYLGGSIAMGVLSSLFNFFTGLIICYLGWWFGKTFRKSGWL
jgi:hypothetical protein